MQKKGTPCVKLTCLTASQHLPCHQSRAALRIRGQLAAGFGHTTAFALRGQQFAEAHDTAANTEGQVWSVEVQHDGQRLGWK